MADKLYEIYETFADQLAQNGWNGQIYGWKETVRAEALEGGWSLFELDNGFKMKLTDAAQIHKEATLQYWFENNAEMVVNVKSLEQLLKLIK